VQYGKEIDNRHRLQLVPIDDHVQDRGCTLMLDA
jgi:hypothetical protein